MNMLLFVFGIVLALILFVTFGVREGTHNGVSFRMNPKQLSALVGIIFMGLSTIHTVPTGHTGIVTTFGHVENYTLEAGIHVMAPWRKVITMDNRTQKKSIQMSCFSSDIQEVTLVYTINYQIDKINAQEIYRTIGTDYFDIIISPKTYEAVKGVFAKYNAESLVSSRAVLAREIEDILKSSLTGYNIEIVSTSLEDLDFTDAFTDAVEAKQVAEQNKLRAQTEQEQQIIEAQAAAEMEVIAAQAQADAAIIAANTDAEVARIQADSAEYQGQKDAAIMSNLGKQLSDYPDLLMYYYVTNWNGQLPETILGDSTNLMYGLGGLGE